MTPRPNDEVIMPAAGGYLFMPTVSVHIGHNNVGKDAKIGNVICYNVIIGLKIMITVLVFMHIN